MVAAFGVVYADQPGESAPASPAKIDWSEARSFWAFQRPTVKEVPESARNAEWVHQKIDAFVLDRMTRAGLEPSPEADRRTWLRRVSFDLTGLPPSPEELETFLADPSDERAAREQVVSRLLDSPHFGERWARLWLDVVRYAEDQAHIVGNNSSLNYPNAWRYRDWVIGALNDDLPYDRFIRQQLAADLIAPEDTESHVALGFVGIGPKYYRRGDLSVTAAGVLQNGDGLPVIGENGPLTVPAGAEVSIAEDGGVLVFDKTQPDLPAQRIGRLKLASTSGSEIEKGLDGLFRVKGGGVLPMDADARVIPGALEQSNVIPSQVLVDMIEAQRLFEIRTNVVSTARELDEGSARLMRLDG